MAILETQVRGAVLVAQFNHANVSNPMSLELEEAICSMCRSIEHDPAIGALVLTGGNERSFCSGGDFNEVARISGRLAVEQFIDRLIGLYSTILNVTKPTVAAIGGYAVGIGFQVALSCDWRVGSPETKLLMWELKHGLACTIGGYMLESFVGRAAMSDIIYGCDTISVPWAAEHKLLHEVVHLENVVDAAVARAQTLSEFPEITFRGTKESVNQRLVSGLRRIAADAKEAHVAGFASGAADTHFRHVLEQ